MNNIIANLSHSMLHASKYAITYKPTFSGNIITRLLDSIQGVWNSSMCVTDTGL